MADEWKFGELDGEPFATRGNVRISVERGVEVAVYIGRDTGLAYPIDVLASILSSAPAGLQALVGALRAKGWTCRPPEPAYYRDPNADCNMYTHLATVSRICQGDGHYLCRECTRLVRADPPAREEEG